MPLRDSRCTNSANMTEVARCLQEGDGEEVASIMNVLAGSAEAAKNISDRVGTLRDQRDKILVLEAHNYQLQTQVWFP